MDNGFIPDGYRAGGPTSYDVRRLKKEIDDLKRELDYLKSHIAEKDVVSCKMCGYMYPIFKPTAGYKKGGAACDTN